MLLGFDILYAEILDMDLSYIPVWIKVILPILIVMWVFQPEIHAVVQFFGYPD